MQVSALLELSGLTRRYAGLVAVDGVDMVVAEGGIHAVIGPNGAGKTTLFNLVSGVVAPSSGRVRFAGQDVTRLPAHRRARLGLTRTFQNIRVFGAMTVLENVLTGLHPRLRAGLLQVVTRRGGFRRRGACGGGPRTGHARAGGAGAARRASRGRAVLR